MPETEIPETEIPEIEIPEIEIPETETKGELEVMIAEKIEIEIGASMRKRRRMKLMMVDVTEMSTVGTIGQREQKVDKNPLLSVKENVMKRGRVVGLQVMTHPKSPKLLKNSRNNQKIKSLREKVAK